MKQSATLSLAGLLLVAHGSRAQTVLQGDSSYLGFRTYKDSMAAVVARLGQHYRKKELLSWYHIRFRNGGSESGTRVNGYALCYRKLHAAFCVSDNKNKILYQIRFYPGAAIASTRGIRPGAATFADVAAQYGPDYRHNRLGQELQEFDTPRKIYQYSQDYKVWYTMLRYKHIAFVSKGKLGAGEDLLKRKVQEIWLW